MTFCRFLPSTFPNCCQLSGWHQFTQTKLSKIIFPRIVVSNRCVVTFSSEQFSCETSKKEAICLFFFQLSFVFTQLKVVHASFFSPFLSFLKCYLSRRMSTQAVLTSPSFTFTQWHTLPRWELPCPTRLLSSSTGAHGIKGKGLLNNCCPFYVFAFRADTMKLCLVCIDSGQQVKPCYSSVSALKS